MTPRFPPALRQLAIGGCQTCLCLFQLHFIVGRVNYEKGIPFFHFLVILYQYFLDIPVYTGDDRIHMRLYLGVIRFFVR